MMAASTPSHSRDVKRIANKYNTRTAEADLLRVQLDEAVLVAREEGETFRSIARLANRSIAWVQGSLERSRKRST